MALIPTSTLSPRPSRSGVDLQGHPPGGSSPGGRVDPDVRAEALVEASFYDEVLHPRNRLGEWLHKEFREVQASSKHTARSVSMETYEAVIAAMDRMHAEAHSAAQDSTPDAAQAQDGFQ
jgi:hypothetical protein